MKIASFNSLGVALSPAAAAYGTQANGGVRSARRRLVGPSTATSAAAHAAVAAEVSAPVDAADISALAAQIFTPLRIAAGQTRQQTIARLAAIVSPLHGRV